MASETIIELEPFLTPIENEGPTGPDLRDNGDSDFAALKTARRKIVSLAKAARFDANVESELQEQWREIRRLGPALLKHKTKDLEVAAWFTEALLKLNGFAGLRDGFIIIKAMVENFWDDIHPKPDEDGMETRAYPLISLNGEDGNGTLILPIKNAPLFADTDLPLSLTSYTRLQEAMQLNDQDERVDKISELGITDEAVQQQLHLIDPAAAQDYIDDLDVAMNTWAEIGALVDQKCIDAEASDVSLPVSGIRNAMEEVRDVYRQLLSHKFQTQTPEDTQGQGSSTVGGSPRTTAAEGVSMATDPLRSREDAINQLLTVANFFRMTEPHSPLCGAIERTAGWARLSLQDLLKELIPDEGARMHYALMTGIQIGEDAVPVGQLAQTARASAPPPPPAASSESSKDSEWNTGADMHSGF